MARIAPALLVAAALLALSACGERTDLRPKQGHTLPPPPHGRVDKPSSAELLQHTPQSLPGLNLELHERSEERTDDAFDLPPKE